jgi:hypothetical protein
MILLRQVGWVDRFPSAKQFVSYSGLDPQVHQSGGKCRTGRISRAGRTPLRGIVVEVANGKSRTVAITAPARHLLVLACQLLTKEEPYPRVDAEKYEHKLQALAAFRPIKEEVFLTDTARAAERLGALTGLPSPISKRIPAPVPCGGAQPVVRLIP